LDTREIQSGPGWDRMKQASFLLDIAKPTPAEQQAAWSTALSAVSEDQNVADSPALLSSQFNLGLTTIRQLTRSVLAEATTEVTEDKRTLHDRLWDACLMSTRPRLDTLAERLDPKATWDEIVLPAEAIDLLRQIAAQVGQRSKVYGDWGFSGKMN